MDPDRELLAVALANLGAALSAAFPVSASFSRSGVAFAAGTRTALAGIIAALLVLATLLFATALFSALPLAVLAAIVIWSVFSLLHPGNLRERWRFSPHDTTAQGVTFVSVLLLGVSTGLMAGILTALALMVRRAARPHITLVGRVGDSAVFRSDKRHEVAMPARVAAVRIDESLHFANVRHVENQLLRLVGERPNLQHLLLVCGSINHVDLSGLEMLERLVAALRELGIRVHLTEVKSPVLDRLEATPFMARLSGNVYTTTDQAIRDLADKV